MMMRKNRIEFNLSQVVEGFNELYKSVSSTIGPGGKLCMIQHPMGVHLTKDGVTIVRSASPVESEKKLGVQILREAAERTLDRVGDGTTTTVVLAKAFYDDMIGGNVRPDTFVDYILEHARGYKIDFDYDAHVWNLLMSSSNGDKEVSGNIKKIFDEIGVTTSIAVQPTKGDKDVVEFERCFTMSGGLLDRMLANDRAKYSYDASSCYIFVTEKKINSVSEFNSQMLRGIMQSGSNLVVFCQGADDSVINIFAENGWCLIDVPRHSGNGENLEDIAAVVGAKVVRYDGDAKLQYIDQSFAGSAERVFASDKMFKIYPNEDSKESIEDRLENIKKNSSSEDTFFQRRIDESRIARLNLNYALIKVSGHTEMEIKEKVDRYDDAIRSVNSAAVDGVVKGSAFVLYDISQKIDYTPLSLPLFRVFENMGLIDGDSCYCFDDEVRLDIPNDLYDPYIVVEESIRNAFSVASSLARTESAIIIEETV